MSNKQIKSESVVSKSVEVVQPKQIGFEKVLSIGFVLVLLMNVYLYSQVQRLTGTNDALVSTIEKLSTSKPTGLQTTDTTIPSGSPVSITILNDKRCTSCDTVPLVTKLKEVFPNAIFNNADYSDSKDLFVSSNVTYLPAVLFDDSVLKSSGYQQVSQYLVSAGNYLSLRIGSAYDPICEGDGRCDLPKCANTPTCRTKIPYKLDLFVMSKCPYGMQALNSMKEVLSTIKNMSFNVHYIANANPQTGEIESLHGASEVSEDMRELCAAKYYKDKHMDYIWCRNANMTSDNWQMCALKVGIPVDGLGKCVSEEGKALLAADMKIAEDLAIGASPTWMVNNYKTFSALSAEDIKTNFCGFNSGAIGCGAKLSSNTSVAPGACATQ